MTPVVQAPAVNRTSTRNRPPTVQQQLSMTASSPASNVVLIELLPVANPAVTVDGGTSACTLSMDDYVSMNYTPKTSRPRTNLNNDTPAMSGVDASSCYSQHTSMNTGYYCQTGVGDDYQDSAINSDCCISGSFDFDVQQNRVPVFQSFNELLNAASSDVIPTPDSDVVSFTCSSSTVSDAMSAAALACSSSNVSDTMSAAALTCSSSTVSDSVSTDDRCNLSSEPTVLIANIDALHSQHADFSSEPATQVSQSADGLNMDQQFSSQDATVSTQMILNDVNQSVDAVLPTSNIMTHLESSQTSSTASAVTSTFSAAISSTAVIVTNLKSASSIVVSDSQLVLPQHNAYATNVDAAVNVGLTGGPVILLTATQLRQLGISVSMLPLTTVSSSRISSSVENSAATDVANPAYSSTRRTTGDILCDGGNVRKTTNNSGIVDELPCESTSSNCTALTLNTGTLGAVHNTADTFVSKNLDGLPQVNTDVDTASIVTSVISSKNVALPMSNGTRNLSTEASNVAAAADSAAQSFNSGTERSLVSRAFSPATGIPVDQLIKPQNERLTQDRASCDALTYTTNDGTTVIHQMQRNSQVVAHREMYLIGKTGSVHEAGLSVDGQHCSNAPAVDMPHVRSGVLVNTDMDMSSIDIAMLNGSLSPTGVGHSIDTSIEANNYDTLQTPKKADFAPVMRAAQVGATPSISSKPCLQPVTTAQSAASIIQTNMSSIQSVTSIQTPALPLLHPRTAWSQPLTLIAQPIVSFFQPMVTYGQPQASLTLPHVVMSSQPVMSSSLFALPTSSIAGAASWRMTTSQTVTDHNEVKLSACPLTTVTEKLVSPLCSTLLVPQSMALVLNPVSSVSQSFVSSCPLAPARQCSTLSDPSLNANHTATDSKMQGNLCSKNSPVLCGSKPSQAVGLHSRSPLKRYSPGFRPILPGEQKVSPSKPVSPSLPKVKPVRKTKRIHSTGLMPIAPKGFVMKAAQISPIKKTAASLTAKARQRRVKDYQKRSSDENKNPQHLKHILPKPAVDNQNKQTIDCEIVVSSVSSSYVDMPLLEGCSQSVCDNDIIPADFTEIEDDCDDDVEDDDDEDEDEDSVLPQHMAAADPTW